MQPKDRASEIQESIRQILLRYWDPLGVFEIPEAQDEYDAYVGGVYRIVASRGSQQEIAAHLKHIETDIIGVSGSGTSRVNDVARLLSTLNVKL